jgi:GNAT superfamily N-acetyltransferase
MMWDYESDFMPEGMEIIERGDLLMWKRPHGPLAQRRWSNRVSYVRAPTERVERTIDEVLEFFGPVAFTWVVGPSSRPADLAARLVARGLVDVGDGDLLTATLPIPGLRVLPDLKIVEVESEEFALIGLRLAHPNADDAEIAQSLRERVAYLRHPGRHGGYLVAFLGDDAVANAGYRYSSDGSTIYLTGAETVERFRRHGVYQTLVAYRAEAAAKRGCRYAAILARRDTSLPVLMKRGFVDHGHLPIFVRPEAAGPKRISTLTG